MFTSIFSSKEIYSKEKNSKKSLVLLLRPLRHLCVLCVRLLAVEKHHSSPSSTNSLARKIALALCSVSFHSISGTESATTPAAAAGQRP